jgi:hypothetical protein
MWNSMKFHGKFHGIQWNSMEFHETEVDEIPWKIPWKIPWNFVNSRNLMEFGFDRVVRSGWMELSMHVFVCMYSVL